MTDLNQAWQTYHQGDYSQAARLFEQGSTEESLIGRALSLHKEGRSDEAIDLVTERVRQHPSTQLQAFLADLKGRMRNRAEAERALTRIVSQNDDDGFYRSLLGEQRIRQGKWKQGTDDFITAINTSGDRAFPHVKLVVADMVDAIMARRISRQQGMKFVNRIDYSVSNKTDEMDQFFARARRDVNANRRMERDGFQEPWAVLLAGSPQHPPARPPSPDRPAPKPSRPPESSPPQSRSDRRKRSKSSARRDRNRPQRQSKERRSPSSDHRRRKGENQRRLAKRPKAGDPARQPAMDARQIDMTAVMQRERQRNEELQDLVAQIDPPIWPSQFEESIDVIQPIGFSDRALLPGSQDIETSNFRITQGAIGVEITLERCMHNLVAAASSASPTTLPLTKESIPRLELNLLDDFLEAMPRLDELYRDETQVEDDWPLAVGKFIGECIVQSYGGVWEHRTPIQDSIIHLGDHTLDPIGLAQKFLSARSFDAVSLRSLIDDADDAVSTSTAFPRFANYIDPTSGMETEALVMNLAELWVGYRFVLPDTALPDVVDSIELVENTDHYILFALDTDFVPSSIIEEHDAAVDTSRRVNMGYIRDSGEFLLLGSRKHFCRFLEASHIVLRNDTASAIAAHIRDQFRPAWNVITDRKSAKKWQEKYGTSDLHPPAIRKNRGETVLRLHAVDTSNSIRKINLGYRPTQTPPYRMAID